MPPIAETLVRILPDTRNFARELEKGVRQQVRDAKLPAVQIKNVQVGGEFKRDLQTKINKIIDEIKVKPVKVPVEVTGGAAAGRAAGQAAGAGGAGRATTSQTAVVSALEAAEKKRLNTARLTATVDDAVTRAKRNLTSLIKQEIAAEGLLERAQASGNQSLVRRVGFLQQRIQKDKEAAQKIIATAQAEKQAVSQVVDVSSIRRGADEVERATAAETVRTQRQAASKAVVDQLNAAEKKRVDTSRLFAATADAETRARKELDSLIRQEIAAEGLLKTAQDTGNQSLVRRVGFLQQRIEKSKQAAQEAINAAQIDKQAARDIERSDKAARAATESLAAAEQHLTAVQKVSAQNTTALAKAKGELAALRKADADLAKAEGQVGESLDDDLKQRVATQRTVVRQGIVDAEKRVETLEKQAVADRDATRAAEQQARAADRASKLRAQGATRLAQVDRLASTASSQLAAAEIRLGQLRVAQTKFLQAEEAARALNNKGLQREIKLLIDDTAQEILNAEARVKNERSMARQARAQSQLTRGGFSSAATFAGLRGATLAASSAFIAGTASVVAFAAALKTFASFEETLNTFRATTGATADEMRRVEEAALRLGRDITLPAVSASDAADAMTQLAKAGLSVNQSISAARGVLQLATAAGIENAQATELVASALNAFGLQGRDAIRVADLFANAANAAQGSIVDFGIAQQQASAIAHQTGISLRDSVAFLTLFAKAGLRGSDAGTSLRTALIRLVNPTDEAASLIEDLGINIRDAQGNIRPDVFAQFGEATQGLSRDLKDMFAATIFGQDAIRAVLVASRAGAAGLAEVQTELSKQGTAAEIAAARTEGLSGKAEQLKNTLSTLGITLGEDVAPAVGEVADAATDLFGVLDSGIHTVEAILGPLQPLSGALEAVFGAFSKGIVPAGLALLAIRKFRPATEAVSGAIEAAQARVRASQARLLGARAVDLAGGTTVTRGTRQIVQAQTELVRSTNAAAVAESNLSKTHTVYTATARTVSGVNKGLALSYDEVAVASTTAARAQGTAAVGGVAAGAASRLAALGAAATALAGPLGIATTAAIGLGIAFQFLGNRESEAEKRTNALRQALQDLSAAQTAFNLNEAKRRLDELLDTFRQADAAIQNFVVGGRRAAAAAGFRGVTPGPPVDTQELEKSIKAARDLAKEFRDSNPVIAHNLNLIADVAKQLDAIPSEKVTNLILENKQTKTSIDEVLLRIATLGPEESALVQAAFRRRAEIGVQAFQDVMHGVLGVPFEFQVEPKINAQAIDRQLRDALNNLEGIDLPLPPAAIPRPIKNMIEDLEAAGPAGRQRLLGIGLDLMDGLREGLDEGGESAVKAARDNLQNVIKQGEEALRQSVRTARGNVQSMADELITQVGQVIDQMEFGIPAAQRQIVSLGLGVDLRDAQSALRQARQEGLGGEALQPFIDNVKDAEKAVDTFAKSGKTDIETLQLALQKLQEQQQRRQLVRGVESAQRDLDKLRGSLGGIAAIAPGGSPVISQMLADQKALVDDAKAELKTFDLTNLIKGAERIRDKYKEAKDEGVKKLVDEFLRGKKTAKEFETQLRTQLAPVLEDLPKKNLGMQFTRAFRTQIDTLVKQAQAVAGFLGIPGTVGAEIERPAAVAAKNAADRLEAARKLQVAIRDESKKTSKNTGDTVTVLKFIAKQFAKRDLTKREIKTLSKGDAAAAQLLKDLNG